MNGTETEREFEFKFIATEHQLREIADDVPPGWTVLERREEHHSDEYFDGPESELHRSCAGLRLRRVGAEATLQFKSGSAVAGRFDRQEVSAALTPRDVAELEAGRSTAKPTIAARRILGDRPPTRALVLDTSREVLVVASRQDRYQLCLDRTEARGVAGVVPLHEVEIELEQGSAEGLRHLAEFLEAAHGLTRSVQSKYGRALRLHAALAEPDWQDSDGSAGAVSVVLRNVSAPVDAAFSTREAEVLGASVRLLLLRRASGPTVVAFRVEVDGATGQGCPWTVPPGIGESLQEIGSRLSRIRVRPTSDAGGTGWTFVSSHIGPRVVRAGELFETPRPLLERIGEEQARVLGRLAGEISAVQLASDAGEAILSLERGRSCKVELIVRDLEDTRAAGSSPDRPGYLPIARRTGPVLRVGWTFDEVARRLTWAIVTDGTVTSGEAWSRALRSAGR